MYNNELKRVMCSRIMKRYLHDLWCAKYLVDNKTAMQESITKLEIEYNLQVNFLKPYQAFTEK